MLIKREVTVKVIVTDDFKQPLIGQFKEALRKVEQTQQQLEVQGKRYLAEIEDRDPSQAEAFRRKLDNQMRRQESVRVRLSQRLTEAESLELGNEYLQGKLEVFEEIRVGDNLSEKLHEAELLVKDDLIVEMRHA